MATADPSYYSQLGRTDLWFYDGAPKLTETDATPVPRARIIADKRVAGQTFTPSFTFKGDNDARTLLRNIAEPQATTDAATKYYVDSVASGLTVKGAVKLRTMGNIDAMYGASRSGVLNDQLSATTPGAFGDLLATLFDLGEESGSTKKISATSFTYTASEDESVATRFLVMNQNPETQNGVYYLEDAGSASTPWKLVRSTNFNDDPSGEIKAGSFVFVTEGTAHKNHGFVLVAAGQATILSTTSASPNNLHFEQFSGAGQLKAGDNIEVTGDTIALVKTVSGLTSLSTGSVTASGAASVGSLTCSGSASVGTLSSGAATLTATLGVAGKVTAGQGIKVTSGGVVVGTLGVTTRSEALQVHGSAYIENDVTLTGVVTASGTGRSVFSDQVLVGSYAVSETVASSGAKFAVAGSAYVHAGLTVTGATALNGNLNVTGAIEASDIATFAKQVTVNAHLRSSTLNVTGATTISGITDLQSTLGVSGATELKSTLEVGAAATLKSSLVVAGDTAITGKSSTEGTSRLKGRVEIGSGLEVTDLSIYHGATNTDRSDAKLGVAGSVWVDGALRVMDSCVLAKEPSANVDIGATSITGTELTTTRNSSKFRVAGAAYVDTALYTGGVASIGGNLSVTGTATVTGVTNLKSRTDIGTVPLTDQSGAMLAVYGTLDVTGTTRLRDKVLIGSTLNTTQTTDTLVTTAALVVNGSAYIRDNVVVNNSLQVNNDSVFADTVTISGVTSIGSFVTATPAKPAIGVTPATTATLTVTGATTFSGSSTDKTTVTTLFDVTNNSKFTGTVSVEEAFYVGKTGSTNTRQSTFYGEIQVNEGDLVVNAGTASTKKKLLASGCTNSEVGFIKFGLEGSDATIVSTLANKRVNFKDNVITTSSDVTCLNVSASGDISATGKGSFSTGCYSSNFYATSDARLKRDVNTVTGALEKCSKLRGVTFKWVAGDDQRDQLGLIAQETQQVYPSLVSEHEGYLRVDYPKLVGLLIEAVKELDERTRPVESA